MNVLVRFIRVAFPIALLLATAVIVPLKLFDHRGITRVNHLEAELEKIRIENAEVRAENEDLRREIRTFHTDSHYVERVARDELGMIGPDEVIYQFPNPKWAAGR